MPFFALPSIDGGEKWHGAVAKKKIHPWQTGRWDKWHRTFDGTWERSKNAENGGGEK